MRRVIMTKRKTTKPQQTQHRAGGHRDDDDAEEEQRRGGIFQVSRVPMQQLRKSKGIAILQQPQTLLHPPRMFANERERGRTQSVNGAFQVGRMIITNMKEVLI